MEKGNGGIQKLLDNGQCPKCETEFKTMRAHKLICQSCGLLMVMPEAENARRERFKEMAEIIKGWSYYKHDELGGYAHMCIEDTLMSLDDLNDLCEMQDFSEDDDMEVLTVIRGILEDEIEIKFEKE